jgi:hypothetical protein
MTVEIQKKSRGRNLRIESAFGYPRQAIGLAADRLRLNVFAAPSGSDS